MSKQIKYSRMGMRSNPGRPKKIKVKPIKNPDYLAGWEWLFGKRQVADRSEGHKFTKRKKSIYGILQYCKQCDQVWELDRCSYRNDTAEYYDNFPTFGLQRRKCPRCKGGKDGSNIQNTNTKPD